MSSDEKGSDNVWLDEKAFELFFKHNFVTLSINCQYKFNFSFEQSKEVVHSAFIKLWESRSTLSPGAPIKAYLYKIITNTSLDILKHENVKERYQEHLRKSIEQETTSSFEEIEVKQLSADIDNAIAKLPEQMRKIFILSRYEKMKYAQIADHLNISVKTVETQMGRALAKLRKSLSDYLYILLVLFYLPLKK